MFVMKMPLFRLDESAVGWGGFFDSNQETQVNDDQPLEESETEDTEIAEETETLETENEEETEESEEPENGQSEEETETVPPFNDDTEVDIGEGRQPVTLKELKAGFLRQSDYTKKTQEIATQRKEVEDLQTQLQPTKQWLDYLESNPWLAQQMNSLVQEFNSTGAMSIQEVLEDAQYGQYVNRLMGQVNTLQKQLDSLTGEHEGLKLTTEMSRLQTDLKADYGELVTDEYMTSLQERGKAEKLPNSVLKELAEAHLAKQKLQQAQQQSKKAAKDAEAKTFQKISEKRTALPSQPRKTGQVPSTGKEPNAYEPVGWGDVFS